MGFFDKLKQGLAKTKITFGFKKVDENLLEELEENLIMADVGMESSEKIIENLRNNIKKENITRRSKKHIKTRNIKYFRRNGQSTKIRNKAISNINGRSKWSRKNNINRKDCK